MINAIDNGILLGDLEASNRRILNAGFLDVTGSGVISSDDPRLTDARNINQRSVYDWAVADNAAISQSKLNLGGDIPTKWLGTTETTAAQGNLAEYLPHKNQPNGYAGLSSGKLPSGSTALSGTGRVTNIHLTMPVYEFAVKETVAGTTRDFEASWKPQNPYTHLTSSGGNPKFSDSVFATASIPNLPASKIGAGIFDLDRLPMAVGVGVGHTAGLVPDTGDPTDEPSLLASDYLARDMTFKRMLTPTNYQPTIPDPAITLQSYYSGKTYINITSELKGSILFYSLDAAPFQEVVNLPLLVEDGVKVSAYAAKDGWNNSEIVSYKPEPPPEGIAAS